MFKIVFFVPVGHEERVKEAMFTAGAGHIGNYDSCSWQVLGVGQFRPLEGAKPFIGAENALERVAEYRVEMVCDDGKIEAVVAAMKAAHPYETPAYEVYRLEDL